MDMILVLKDMWIIFYYDYYYYYYFLKKMDSGGIRYHILKKIVTPVLCTCVNVKSEGLCMCIIRT